MPHSTLNDYLQAATRYNTRKSYQTAIEHFEVRWGGVLPASAKRIADYLAHYAPQLTISTLRHRVAALSHWHKEQGFPDPCATPLVKNTLRGIAAKHPHKPQQAKPLLLDDIQKLITYLQQQIQNSEQHHNTPLMLRSLRNQALLLLGFWRAFRADELSRLCIEHITIMPNQGMEIFLPYSKTDTQHQGRYYRVPMLSQLCPVHACQQWLAASSLTQGAVFRSINRWGHLATQKLHSDSIAVILRDLCQQAELPHLYSSHSLRRGFASWANQQQWDLKTLMDYVGWRDPRTALRYMEVDHVIIQQRIEQALQPATALASKTKNLRK